MPHFRRYPCAVSFAVVLFGSVRAATDGLQEMGGGALREQARKCLSPVEEARILSRQAAWLKKKGIEFEGKGSIPLPYTYYPQAGLLWSDVFPGNFVDLDPGGGILDYNCTGYTYDGHNGIDSDILSFEYQALGVPVFAALDGEVVDLNDGEPDMNTVWDNQPANYVILNHGGTHFTWYWHLKNGSVAVGLGEQVRAGRQLGLTASSGNSTGPHLHFESRWDGEPYEPFAGACRTGESNWVDQPAFQPNVYVRDFAATRDSPSGMDPQFALPRHGFQAEGFQTTYFHAYLANLPANSTWRFRFRRPNDSIRFESTVGNFGNGSLFRSAWYWFNWNITFDTPGTWTVEFMINDQLAASAPLEIVTSLSEEMNRSPFPVSPAFDPVLPKPEDVLRCYLADPSIPADPDHDVVSYRWLWKVNGDTVREVTTAAWSDVLPRLTATAGDNVTCEVTPTDGAADAVAQTATVVVAGSDSNPPGTPSLSPVLTVRLPSPSVDPDGDDVLYRYEWSSDGGDSLVVHGPTGLLEDSLDETSQGVTFDEGETWQVTVIPIDINGVEGVPAIGTFVLGPDADVTFEGWTFD